VTGEDLAISPADPERDHLEHERVAVADRLFELRELRLPGNAWGDRDREDRAALTWGADPAGR
jgi:hypothetical protein